MAERKKQISFVVVLLYLLGIVVALIMAALLTMMILMITDAVLYESASENTSKNWYKYSRNKTFERVNWTFAVVVFIVSFIAVEISIRWKDLKAWRRRRNQK